MCERILESNCLDGLDNNGDGLADCADPSCNALVQCVPDVGAGNDIGIVLPTGPCPVGYDAQVVYHDTLQGMACTGCSCKTKCSSDLYLSNVNTCAEASMITTIAGPADGITLCTNIGPYSFGYGYSSAPVVAGCASGVAGGADVGRRRGVLRRAQVGGLCSQPNLRAEDGRVAGVLARRHRAGLSDRLHDR